MPIPTHQRNLSYEDTIEALAALLTQWYTLHLSLPIPHTTTTKTHISQPPHTVSASLISSWKQAGMSDLVIQTLQLLPYLSGSREVAPDTRVLDYLDEEGEALSVWRDPFCLGAEGGVEVKQGYGYLGNAVPLTACIGSLGWVLVLDLDDNNIYEIRNKDHQPPLPCPPKNTPKWYYKHYLHSPAIAFLKLWIEKTKDLVWVWDPRDGVWLQDTEEEWDEEGAARFMALKQVYGGCGWPERFDEGAFWERWGMLGRARGWED